MGHVTLSDSMLRRETHDQPLQNQEENKDDVFFAHVQESDINISVLCLSTIMDTQHLYWLKNRELVQ